jgi:polyphosphate glucokinase
MRPLPFNRLEPPADNVGTMRILAIDVGGSKTKCLLSGETERRVAPSGPGYTPERFVDDVKRLVAGERFDRVTIGFPAPIKQGHPAKEPVNLGTGWMPFDYRAAFNCPVKFVNDAAMQAVGSYQGGRMVFLGLGTGLGTAMIDESHLIALEAAHLPYKKRLSFEEWVGNAAKERLGKRRWREEVAEVCAIFRRTFLPDYIVLGGGNAKELKEVPEGCRLGDNSLAFLGGFRVWDREWASSVPECPAMDAQRSLRVG